MFLPAALAATARYRALVITSVGTHIFVLRLFYYCMIMESAMLYIGLVSRMYSAKQGGIDSNQLPPCAD